VVHSRDDEGVNHEVKPDAVFLDDAGWASTG